MHRLARALSTAAATVLTIGLLSACSTPAPAPSVSASATAVAEREPLSSLAVVADPRDHDGPSTATLSSEAIEPVASDPAPALPASVESHDPHGDVPVTVTTADRIVAMDLSGSLAGTVYGLGLGDRLVGRDVATTLPGTADLPLVTSADGQSVSAEAMLALRPDVLLVDGTVGPTDVVQQLRDSGIAVVYVKNESSFAGASAVATQVAQALGVPDAGSKLAARITSDVAATTAAIDGIAPSAEKDRVRMVFLYLRGGSGIYYLFGSGSGAEELIDGLGGVDAAKEIGWSGMKPMTDEAMVAMDPDLILVMTKGLESVGGIDGLLSSKPAIALTSAGKHRRIVDMADGDVLSFGPRSAAVLDALARAVYAPAG